MACASNHPSDGDDRRAATLKNAMARLPYITAAASGIGGSIKAEPAHFEVEEMLPYEPCGEGQHLYIKLKRAGWNTPDVAAALARALSLKLQDVGWGGRKDKQAVCTQTFSLDMPTAVSLETIRTRLAPLPFEILDLRRHRNKIRTGHVAANRFRILLSQVAPEALDQALAIAALIRRFGVPNFYGPQRFGVAGGNLDRAVELLANPRAARRHGGAFMVSVLQSALFNQWLSERIRRGAYHTIVKGDVARKTDTGGLFTVDDLADAAKRFASGAIDYTGPIFGHKMMVAADAAGAWEQQILDDFNLRLVDFKALQAPGSRRAARLDLPDLSLAPSVQGLVFSFTLPSGAYATTVLREFMRQPVEHGADHEDR